MLHYLGLHLQEVFELTLVSNNHLLHIVFQSQYIFIHRTLLEMFACTKDPVVGRDMFYQVWADSNFKDKVHDEYLVGITIELLLDYFWEGRMCILYSGLMHDFIIDMNVECVYTKGDNPLLNHFI